MAFDNVSIALVLTCAEFHSNITREKNNKTYID